MLSWILLLSTRMVMVEVSLQFVISFPTPRTNRMVRMTRFSNRNQLIQRSYLCLHSYSVQPWRLNFPHDGKLGVSVTLFMFTVRYGLSTRLCHRKPLGFRIVSRVAFVSFIPRSQFFILVLYMKKWVKNHKHLIRQYFLNIFNIIFKFIIQYDRMLQAFHDTVNRLCTNI